MAAQDFVDCFFVREVLEKYLAALDRKDIVSCFSDDAISHNNNLDTNLKVGLGVANSYTGCSNTMRRVPGLSQTPLAGIGHDIPQKAPKSFADAILELGA